MSDPLRDPRFPNRPQSPDFWRMSESAMQLDGRTTEDGLSFEQIVESLCDVDALTYVSAGRVANVESRIGQSVDPVSAWMDGFIIGLLFQQKGGHQQADGND